MVTLLTTQTLSYMSYNYGTIKGKQKDILCYKLQFKFPIYQLSKKKKKFKFQTNQIKIINAQEYTCVNNHINLDLVKYSKKQYSVTNQSQLREHSKV